MKKINLGDIEESSWESPKGKFASADKEISVALGRKPNSTDLMERQPFDVEICRIPPGKKRLPVPFAQRHVGILSSNLGPRCGAA